MADGGSAAAGTSRVLLTRDLIVEAARAQLVEDGAVSLRKLAGRLGVTAPALYAHFAGKSELLRAIAEEELERLAARMEAVQAADPVDRMRAHSYAYVDHALERPALFHVMFLFRPDWAAGADGVDLPVASRAFAVAAEPVREATVAGRLVGADPFLTSLTIWSAVHGVATVLLADTGLPADYQQALVDSVIDRLFAGLTVAPAPAPDHRPTSSDGA